MPVALHRTPFLLAFLCLWRFSSLLAADSAVGVDLAVSVTADRLSQDRYANVTFTVTLTNEGDLGATGVEVYFPKPADYKLTAATASQGRYSDWTGSWKVGDVPAGAARTLEVTLFLMTDAPRTAFVEVREAQPADLDSEPGNGTALTPAEDDEAAVTINGDGSAPPPSGGGGGGGGAVVTPPSGAAADLSLALSADRSRVPQYDYVEYTLVVRNDGPGTARGVEVAVPKPADLPLSDQRATQGKYSDWSGIWKVGELGPGSQQSLVVKRFTLTTEPRTVSAQVMRSDAPDPDSEPGNASGAPSEDDEVAIVTNAANHGGGDGPGDDDDAGTGGGKSPDASRGNVDLELSLAADRETVERYAYVAYTLTLRNAGEDAAQDVTVSFPKPDDYAFSAKAVSLGRYSDWSGRWSVGTLAGGSEATLEVRLYTLTDEERTAFAEVTACRQADGDSQPGNASPPTPREDDEASWTTNPAPPPVPHISEFESLAPAAQGYTLVLPQASHDFQLLTQTGDVYTDGTRAGRNNDFTAYLGRQGSSERGFLSVNFEDSPGGVAMLEVSYDEAARLWRVDRGRSVDFGVNGLGGTLRNCSGAVTPWGTVLTAEETTTAGDGNGDGYQDYGWLIELDPATARIAPSAAGRREKLWALGRVKHENAVVAADSRTVYFGEDGPSGAVYKFVADEAEDLSAGKLYVLELPGGLSATGEPGSSRGKWLAVPNTSIADRNRVSAAAQSLGATNFTKIEDVDISPRDGRVYFAAKGAGRVYSFRDDGDGVSGFRSFLGARSYPVRSGGRTYDEPWGTGNDNLAFDDRGNLWVCQDGGRDYIWVVGPEHTDAAPDVRIFGRVPLDAEPTGLTFTPDYRFAFFSVQHPSTSNGPQRDASGREVTFDASGTVVFARRARLGGGSPGVGNRSADAAHEPAAVGTGLAVSTASVAQLSLGVDRQVADATVVDLHDAVGRRLGELGRWRAGETGDRLDVDLSGWNLSPGVYVVRAVVGGEVASEVIELFDARRAR